MTPRPYTLVAELTHRCPLACAYCANPLALVPRGDELDTATWERLVREAEGLGVVQLHLTGGEPLVRDDLEAIVTAARAAGVYTNLITSGVPLTVSRLDRLAAAGLDAVQLSIQDVNDGAAARIAGVDVAARKRDVAGWVKARGLPLTLNVVLHRDNLPRVATIVAYAERLGADRLELANTQYLGWALANRAALLPDTTMIEQATHEAAAARRRLRGVMEIAFVLPDHHRGVPKACMDGWGRRFIVITPAGRVQPCHLAGTLPRLVMPSVHDAPLATLWHDAPAFTAFRGDAWMPEPCRSCPQRHEDFGGCRCQAYALTGDAAATDPACRFAPDHWRVVAARTAAAVASAELVHRAPAG